MHSPQTFDNSDIEYHSWLAQHPDGHVLNLRRNPSSVYCVLHRARCYSIAHQNGEPGRFTQRQYIKVCADEVAPLATYASGLKKRTGAFVATGSAPFSKRCGLCAP